MTTKPTAIVYVDGFNLYKRQLEGSSNKWLNLASLFDDLLPDYEVLAVKYFTAPLKQKARPKDPGAPARQQVYLRALRATARTHVIEGTFSVRTGRAAKAVRRVTFRPRPRLSWKHGRVVMIWKVQEKASDVNLASHLLLDAFKSLADLYCVVTSDSDLETPLCMVTADLGGQVALVYPAGERSKSLARCVPTLEFYLTESRLERNQFPSEVRGPKGPIFKPRTW